MVVLVCFFLLSSVSFLGLLTVPFYTRDDEHNKTVSRKKEQASTGFAWVQEKKGISTQHCKNSAWLTQKHFWIVHCEPKHTGKSNQEGVSRKSCWCPKPSTHYCRELGEHAIEEYIGILFFPHNMTTRLQPLDRGIFGKHKKLYRIGRSNIQTCLNNNGVVLDVNVCYPVVPTSIAVKNMYLQPTHLFGMGYLQRTHVIASECPFLLVEKQTLWKLSRT